MLAAWRAVAYRLFAALFLPPDERRWLWLVETARELRSLDAALSSFAFFPSWDRLLRVIEASNPESVAQWSVEYTRLFIVGRGAEICSPYESSYAAASAEQAGMAAALVARAYARAGVEAARRGLEDPDHVAVELEFLAYLCQREAAAWSSRDTHQALRALAEERTFLRQHLGRWFGAFAEGVHAASREPLYGLAAAAAHTFIHHDAELLDRLTSDLPRLASRGEPLHRRRDRLTESSGPQ